MAITRDSLRVIMTQLALSTLDFVADDDGQEGGCALVADEAIPYPLAQMAQARIEAAGGEASWAPDHQDRELAWLYVVVQA